MISLYDFENSYNKRIKRERYDAKEEQTKKTAAKMYNHGDDLAYIADMVGYTADTVKQWLGLSLTQ